MPSLTRWMTVALLLGAAAYAVAEELTLTTYYPSPRGVYQELRVNGNVGIGTPTPAAILDVHRTALDTGIAAQVVHNNYTNSGLVLFNSDTETGGLMIGQESESNGGQIVISNRARSASGGHQLALARDGKIGIGKTTPGAKLEVADGSYPNALGRIRLNSSETHGGVDVYAIWANGTQTGNAACQNHAANALCIGFWASSGAVSSCTTPEGNGRALCAVPN